LTVSRKTHLTGWGARVRLWRQRPRKREGAVAWVVTGIWCDELVVVLVLLLVLLLLGMLGSTFPTRVASGSRIPLGGRAARRVRRVAIAEARKADRARLHVVARDVCMVRDEKRLGEFVGFGVCVCSLVWGVWRIAHGLGASIEALQRGDGGIGVGLTR